MLNKNIFKPIYLNKFETIIGPEIDLDCFSDEMTYCKIELNEKYLLCHFNDHLDAENKFLIYPKLFELKVKNIKIPKLVIKVHDEIGDVFLCYTFFDLKVRNIMDLEFTKKSSSSLLLYASFNFNKVLIETNNNTIEIKKSLFNRIFNL